MAALEPSRKRPTTFTIESIVGRSSPSPPRPSPASPSRHRGDSSPPLVQRSSSWKPTSESGSTHKATSSTAAGHEGPGSTSAGRHLELLARFAAPNLPGVSAAFSTASGMFGGGGGSSGVLSVAEALLRAGHLPYSAVELMNGGNGFAGPALTSRLEGQASMDGGRPAPLPLFCGGSMWNPQDLARRVPPQTWSSTSLVHPLTTGVRPTADHSCIHHPYAGKYSTYIHVYTRLLNIS